MPEPPTIEHHRPVDYRISEHDAAASGFTVRPSADRRRIEVSGACPGCGGLTTTVWDYGTGNGYKGIFRRRPAAAPTGGADTGAGEVTRTVCCDCGHAHANRPADAVFLGCGAYWQVPLP